MNVALILIHRTGPEIWSWTVEYDNPHLGRTGRASSREDADRMVRDVLAGKV